MTDEQKLDVLENAPQIRRIWHKERQEWLYSIVDVIAFLTDSPKPSNYWHAMRTRMIHNEGVQETLSQIEEIPMKSVDGRFRKTVAANRQTLLRLIQSIPSPKAEPFKLWLAQVGEERIEEIEHPEDILEKIRDKYRRLGRSEEWIEERIRNDLIRNELTDEWRDRGAQDGVEFAVLTNTLSKGTFGVSVQVHKSYKQLPGRENLRDHMTPMELVLCSLSEVTATTLHRKNESQGFVALQQDTVEAGHTAGQARELVEKTIGEPVLSSHNFLADPSAPQKKMMKGRTQQKKLANSAQEAHQQEDVSTPTLFDILEQE